MRARAPDHTGIVERDGVRVAWQSYGDLRRPDDAAVLLLPTWCIVPADVWKLQIPFLARRTRVVTFDPRGNGRSDRPREPAAYRRTELTRDALDVLDATGTGRVVVVALSAGNEQALDLASGHAERVAAWVAIAPSIRGLGTYSEERDAAFARWNVDTGDDRGWGLYNRWAWRRDYAAFVDFFFAECVTEPHSTKLVEDLVGWAQGTDGDVLVATERARPSAPAPPEALTAAVECPVVVVHGTDDHVIPPAHGARLAELTGGTLVSLVGSGHMPQGRDPVAVNRLIDRVLSGTTRFTPPRRRCVGRSRG
jgi:pimeloyl-ACP methyl ester carboxylesterase